jgi:acetylornithine deacetylase
MTDPLVALLSDLVAIDSVNSALVPGGAGEAAIADRIAQELRASGLDVTVADAAVGRPNVVGVLESRQPGRSLMLCGHSDTVGVAGMDAPFEPIVRGDRLYGRGSQDMKGGVAAILSAARSLASEGLPGGRVVVAIVADEEHLSVGADALVRDWTADAAVVTEPTDLTIAIGHKGFAWVEIVTEGRAAHGSRPREGRDAILRMGRVLSGLERLDRELQGRTEHPFLGTGSLHASLVEGGRELSSYPDRCVLQMERRLLTGEPEDTALREAVALLAALRAEDPEFQASARLTFGRPAYETPEGHPLPALLEESLARQGRPAQRGGATFWTDAAILGHAGIPSVVFGPGGAGLHSLDEHVRLSEVAACRDALVDLARSFCAGA